MLQYVNCEFFVGDYIEKHIRLVVLFIDLLVVIIGHPRVSLTVHSYVNH